jgi:hypothetical protein
MKKSLLFLLCISVLTGLNPKAPTQSYGNLIKKGQEHINFLYGKSTTPIPILDEEYLESIVAITHYLCSKVPGKNGGYYFSSGTIVIEDTDWKLYQFLLEYVKKKFNEEIKKEIWISTRSAYPRHSTHFNSYYLYTGNAIHDELFFNIIKKTNPDYFHYGIDLKRHQRLPLRKKRHILWGKIGTVNGKNLLFIKFEKVGLKSQDALEHVLELIKYKIKNQTPALHTKLLEKLSIALPPDTVLQETLEQIAQSINPQISLIENRRETIPLAFIGEYIALLFSQESNVTDKKILEGFKEKAKAFGIQEIVRSSQDLSQSDQGTPKWRMALGFLAEEIKGQYPDDWEFRFGNEVILTQQDFVDKDQKHLKPVA